MVNNHGNGDRKSPKDRIGLVVNGRTSWLIKVGDPNHFLSGMILQVLGSNIWLNLVDPPPKMPGI